MRKLKDLQDAHQYKFKDDDVDTVSWDVCCFLNYCKNPKFSDTRKFLIITLKVEQDGFSLEKCIQKMQRELQTV